MTTCETRETTQPLTREKLKGQIAQAAGGSRGDGAAIGRSPGRQLGRLGWPDEVARVLRFLCAELCSLITGQVWALVRGEM
jgi:NAD(P)-dependent dehydrogenase (short-subunit alcohol dehydrogenase family)